MQEAIATCLLKWGNIRVLHRYGDEDYVCRWNGNTYHLSPQIIASASASALAYLENIPEYPVRLDKIHGKKALPADFKGVPFEKYLAVENLYQGYLDKKNDAFLDEIAAVLYDCRNIKLNEQQRISVFYWIASLKQYLCKLFPNFLRPVNSTQNDNNLLDEKKPLGKVVIDSMNAQLRALTKGDVTKEAQVLQLDTWRALTELDALAKEYEEINRKYNSKK